MPAPTRAPDEVAGPGERLGIDVAPLLDANVAGRWSVHTRRLRTLANPALAEALEALLHDYPGMRRSLERRGGRTGRSLDDPALQAEVALVSVLRFGWAIFEDDVMRALEPYEPRHRPAEPRSTCVQAERLS